MKLFITTATVKVATPKIIQERKYVHQFLIIVKLYRNLLRLIFYKFNFFFPDGGRKTTFRHMSHDRNNLRSSEYCILVDYFSVKTHESGIIACTYNMYDSIYMCGLRTRIIGYYGLLVTAWCRSYTQNIKHIV